MRRGTTPIVILTTNADLTDFDKIWITFSQNSQIIINKEWTTSTSGGITVTSNEIDVPLTQAETLLLGTGDVKVQVRALNGQKAIASDIVSTSVGAILKEGVIS